MRTALVTASLFVLVGVACGGSEPPPKPPAAAPVPKDPQWLAGVAGACAKIASCTHGNDAPRLRDPGAFGGWLSTIARNRATDFHRRAVDAVELPEELPGRDGTEARTEALAVLEIIKALPEAYRETLVLRLVEGLTGPEIAERTGLTPASVRVNLHRGMKLLREKL